MELHGTFPWNSMENVDAGISMEIGVLMFSMEFHGKCPNPPCKYFHGNLWRNFHEFHGNGCHNPPWNSTPWRFFTREVSRIWILFG